MLSEKIKGTISDKILGKNGFGYDPIFIPKNYKKTFGEMLKSKKLKLTIDILHSKCLKKKLKFCKFVSFCSVYI